MMLALPPPADLARYLAAGLSAWAVLPDGRTCDLTPAPGGWWYVGIRGGSHHPYPVSAGRALWWLRVMVPDLPRPDRLTWEPGWEAVNTLAEVVK
jgi:hypothetical protein